MNLKLTGKNKIFYKEMLAIAFPVMLQQLIIVAVQLCDTIMVGSLGEEPLAAVGAANQIFIVYIDSVFGFLSGVAVFSAQYWGIKDLKALRSLLGLGYVTVFIFGAVTTVFVYWQAPFLLSLFTDNQEVIALGIKYIRIAVFTYLIGALTFVISYNSRVISRLKWPTIINACAVAINIFLNWVFIFGHLGAKPMGVEGAATATLIARIIEFALTMAYIYAAKGHPLGASIKEMKFSFELFKEVVKTALPVVANEVLWVLSFTATFAIYGRISAVALAVVQVAMTVTDIFQSIYFGMANGCAVIIGKSLGRGDREEGFRTGKRCLKITWCLNIVCSLLLILARGPIVAIYSFPEATNALLFSTLLVYAIAITPKMLPYVYICGIFRPGGDTLWSAIVDGGLNWFLQVPLAWISVVTLGLPLPACIAVVALADAVKGVVCHFRFRSKKWINVFTGDRKSVV